MEITKQFARFIHETTYESLPLETISMAKDRLLDTTGAALAGYGSWPFREHLIASCAQLGIGDCNIIGMEGRRFPAARAAMLNATFAHAVELDDGHKNAGVHAGAVVVPTALTIGAKLGCSGRELLAAIVIGYEIVYRLAVSESPALIRKGFHPSATCGTFGAMAVAGKLMGLSEEQLTNGLGLAGLFAAGLMEATVSGQQSKCVMVGNAALNGITAAYFARSGLEGTITVFEGQHGIFNAMSENVKPEEVCKDLGKRFLIGDTYNKFYPTCRHSQPAIEAVLDLTRENGFGWQEIEKVLVGTHQVAYDLTGTIYAPRNGGEAKFSIPYGVAAALIDHRFAIRHLQEEYYSNTLYTDLARRVEVRVDDTVNGLYPKKRGAIVDIVLKDGRRYSRECYDLKGSPNNPVGREELIAKFRDNTMGVLPGERVELLIAKSAALEEETNASSFVDLLTWSE